jgi:hypothetical protein
LDTRQKVRDALPEIGGRSERVVVGVRDDQPALRSHAAAGMPIAIAATTMSHSIRVRRQSGGPFVIGGL